MKNNKIRRDSGGVRNSAVASQPCPPGHITADKREIKDFPFIRKTLSAISLWLQKNLKGDVENGGKYEK